MIPDVVIVAAGVSIYGWIMYALGRQRSERDRLRAQQTRMNHER